MRGGTTVQLGDGTLLESLLPRAVELIGEFHEADLGGVAEWSDGGTAVKVSIAPTDIPGGEVSVHRSPPSTAESMNAYALADGSAIVATDLPSEARFSDALLAERGVTSAMIVPIVVRDEPVGTLGIYWTRTHRFVPEDVQAAEAIARLLSTKVSRAESWTQDAANVRGQACAEGHSARGRRSRWRGQAFLAIWGMWRKRTVLARTGAAASVCPFSTGSGLPRFTGGFCQLCNSFSRWNVATCPTAGSRSMWPPGRCLTVSWLPWARRRTSDSSPRAWSASRPRHGMAAKCINLVVNSWAGFISEGPQGCLPARSTRRRIGPRQQARSRHGEIGTNAAVIAPCKRDLRSPPWVP